MSCSVKLNNSRLDLRAQNSRDQYGLHYNATGGSGSSAAIAAIINKIMVSLLQRRCCSSLMVIIAPCGALLLKQERTVL
jgi:hypothetical protein